MADYPITIKQGATFDLTLELTDESGDPIDLTGYSARAQIRKGLYSETALLSLTSPIVDGEGIGIDPESGSVRVLIKATTTAELDFFRGVWDLEVFTADDAQVISVAEGECTLSREVTRG